MRVSWCSGPSGKVRGAPPGSAEGAVAEAERRGVGEAGEGEQPQLAMGELERGGVPRLALADHGAADAVPLVRRYRIGAPHAGDARGTVVEVQEGAEQAGAVVAV